MTGEGSEGVVAECKVYCQLPSSTRRLRRLKNEKLGHGQDRSYSLGLLFWDLVGSANVCGPRRTDLRRPDRTVG